MRLCWLVASVAILIVAASFAHGQESQAESAPPSPVSNRLQEESGTNLPRLAPEDSAATPADPATPSPKLREALELIRGVDEFRALAREVERLQLENARLREELSRKFTEVPEITVIAKAISTDDALVVLQVGPATLRVRPESEVFVPIDANATTPMKVKSISLDRIEVEFPELNRTMFLYD